MDEHSAFDQQVYPEHEQLLVCLEVIEVRVLRVRHDFVKDLQAVGSDLDIRGLLLHGLDDRLEGDDVGKRGRQTLRVDAVLRAAR